MKGAAREGGGEVGRVEGGQRQGVDAVGGGAVVEKRGRDSMVTVSKRRFVLFLAEVINSGMQMESRRMRLGLIARCAGRYLGVEGLTEESMQRELEEEVAVRQEGPGDGGKGLDRVADGRGRVGGGLG